MVRFGQYLIGIAHWHRNDKFLPTSSVRRLYFHRFYYTMAVPPFDVLGVSDDFRFPASFGNATDLAQLDRVQFAVGLSLTADGRYMLATYGVGDCQARAIEIPIPLVMRALGLPANA